MRKSNSVKLKRIYRENNKKIQLKNKIDFERESVRWNLGGYIFRVICRSEERKYLDEFQVFSYIWSC